MRYRDYRVFVLELIETGLQPRHIRPSKSHPGAQRQRSGLLSVAGSEAAVFERYRPNRQCKEHVQEDEKHTLTRQVWCTRTFQHLYALWSPYDIGDIFCVAYSSYHRTVYLGAQNTSIQVWQSCSPRSSADSTSGTMSRRKTLDPRLPSHRIPRNARTASSTRLAPAAYKHPNAAGQRTDQKTQ
jgi:hypothetical protein